MNTINPTDRPMAIGMVITKPEHTLVGARLAHAGHRLFWCGPRDLTHQLAIRGETVIGSIADLAVELPNPPVVWFAGTLDTIFFWEELKRLRPATLAIDGRPNRTVPIGLASQDGSDLRRPLPRLLTVKLRPDCGDPREAVKYGYLIEVAGYYPDIMLARPLLDSLRSVS